MPIIGDDLYGVKANRLHLHAETLELTHPITHEPMRFHVDADF
ncbi:ribosomal large subunit pseudouridine synthase A [Photobacterium aphoticum]|uniref:Ribosomal large subunit pseudouridine synthase A n=1 Tax=Photobacterium aphoticum TaxID=754436 RepID=A0A090QM19_9GAMM|nr:ribosomal large subunit pseudouridine synthase A [Photobacterium aphoticum]